MDGVTHDSGVFFHHGRRIDWMGAEMSVGYFFGDLFDDGFDVSRQNGRTQVNRSGGSHCGDRSRSYGDGFDGRSRMILVVMVMNGRSDGRLDAL